MWVKYSSFGRAVGWWDEPDELGEGSERELLATGGGGPRKSRREGDGGKPPPPERRLCF